MVVCIVAKCLQNTWNFTKDTKYYFKYTVNGNLGTIVTFNDLCIAQKTTHKRTFIEGQQKLSIRGCLFDIVGVKEVGEDFNFQLGEYSLESVLSETDSEEYKRLKKLYDTGKITNKDIKRAEKLHSKYINKLKLEV